MYINITNAQSGGVIYLHHCKIWAVSCVSRTSSWGLRFWSLLYHNEVAIENEVKPSRYLYWVNLTQSNTITPSKYYFWNHNYNWQFNYQIWNGTMMKEKWYISNQMDQVPINRINRYYGSEFQLVLVLVIIFMHCIYRSLHKHLSSWVVGNRFDSCNDILWIWIW